MKSTTSLGEYYCTACHAKVGERAGTRLASNAHEERVYIQELVKYMQVRVKKKLAGLTECQVAQLIPELVQGYS